MGDTRWLIFAALLVVAAGLGIAYSSDHARRSLGNDRDGALPNAFPSTSDWESSVDLDIDNSSSYWGWQLTMQLHEPIRLGNESVVRLDSVVSVDVFEYGIPFEGLHDLAAGAERGAESYAMFDLAPRLNTVAGWARQNLSGVVVVEVSHAGKGDDRGVVFDPRTATWYEIACDWNAFVPIEPTPTIWSKTSINVKPRAQGECSR